MCFNNPDDDLAQLIADEMLADAREVQAEWDRVRLEMERDNNERSDRT